MKKMLILLICFYTNILISQNKCAYEMIQTTSIRGSNNSLRSDCCINPVGSFTIPVAFHVFKKSSNQIDFPSDASLANLILETNLLLAPHFTLVPIMNPNDCSMISFRPSEIHPVMNFENELEIKNISRIDPNVVLNVWILEELVPNNTVGSVNGWTYSPSLPEFTTLKDGIALTAGGSTFTKAKTFAHEIGHYLTLHHVWGPEEFGATNCSTSDDCNSGDLISDTEPCWGPVPHLFTDPTDPTSAQVWPIGPNCTYDQDDINFIISRGAQNPYCTSTSGTYPCRNLMNYTFMFSGNQVDELTNGQFCRMIDALEQYRPNLGAYIDLCLPACPDPCNPCYVGTPFNNPAPDTDVIVSAGESKLINIPTIIDGNLIVENGGTLHIHLTTLDFAGDKGIIVKNGGTLILQGSTIDVCDATQSWAGIKLESGAFFDTDDAVLLNVTNGVDAKANSTLQIFNLKIRGEGLTNSVGLRLDGNVNTDFIYHLNIKDFDFGIRATNGSSNNKVHEFNHGVITNTNYGIHTTGSTILVNDYNILETTNGVSLVAAPGSAIFDSEIVFKDQGVYVLFSNLATIQNSKVSNKYNVINSQAAIGVVLSDNCIIKNNLDISSATNAVSVWGSNRAEIDNNNISTDFSLNGQLVGGPVNLIFGNGHKVTFNDVSAFQSEFGINSNFAGSTEIMNNTIYSAGPQKNFRTAAIKATGNLDETISQNIIEGFRRTGILIQNTTGNNYFCNEVTSYTDVAQDILFASDMQTLKANTFEGAFDLKIASDIGPQATFNGSGNIIANNGNLFKGGTAVATGLNSVQIFSSRFPVNSSFSFHLPTTITPAANWFIPNNVTAYTDCNGLVIGNNIIFNGDPNKICAYWTYLKSIRSTKPELFFVKLVHLLKYSKIKAGFTMPNCITFDPVFQSLCGVTKLVDVSVELSKTSTSSVNTSVLKSLQAQYKIENGDLAKSTVKDQIQTEMVNLKPQFITKIVTDSIKIDSLRSELNAIICTDIIVKKWKDILIKYTNFIKKGKVEETDKLALETYSMECSDTYGEAIHLARAMVNTYNKTYYDVYDGCLQSSTERVNLSQSNMDIIVAPNPTNGNVNVDFNREFTGEVSIYNTNGRKIRSQAVMKSNGETIDLSNEQAGLYLMQVVSKEGVSQEFKIILIN